MAAPHLIEANIENFLEHFKEVHADYMERLPPIDISPIDDNRSNLLQRSSLIVDEEGNMDFHNGGAGGGFTTDSDMSHLDADISESADNTTSTHSECTSSIGIREVLSACTSPSILTDSSDSNPPSLFSNSTRSTSQDSGEYHFGLCMLYFDCCKI